MSRIPLPDLVARKYRDTTSLLRCGRSPEDGHRSGRLTPPGEGSRRSLVTGVLANLATHPVLWVRVHSAGTAYWAALGTGETAVWLAEAGLAWCACRVRTGGTLSAAAAVSLTANAASALAGPLAG